MFIAYSKIIIIKFKFNEIYYNGFNCYILKNNKIIGILYIINKNIDIDYLFLDFQNNKLILFIDNNPIENHIYNNYILHSYYQEEINQNENEFFDNNLKKYLQYINNYYNDCSKKMNKN